ncbi:MAG: hypothetical protein DWI24_03290 [Planctomycetota bacterium]|nr:MAG: hypothetical protein DWI24_03290 [Planctomycetota bacterium]
MLGNQDREEGLLPLRIVKIQRQRLKSCAENFKDFVLPPRRFKNFTTRNPKTHHFLTLILWHSKARNI